MQSDRTRLGDARKRSKSTAAPPSPVTPGLAPGSWATASLIVRGRRPCMDGSSPRKTKPAASCRKAGRPALFVLMFLGCFAAGLPTAQAERRVAMVIGNAAYQSAPPLMTPTTDAAEVSKLLRALDFSVIELTNVDKVGMERALRQFSAEMNDADVALFYYSGHGVQVGDVNYLVPISAKIDGPRSLALDTIALQDIRSAMQEAGVKVELLFLDACRDNPFAGAFVSAEAKGATRGFAPVKTTTGSLVAFSTSPGQVARDGTGDVSPFTRGFLRYAAVPGLDISQVLTRVRSYVARETDNQQVPWDSSSLLGDFYLVPKRAAPCSKNSRLSSWPAARPSNLYASRRRRNRKGAQSASRSSKRRPMDFSCSIPDKFTTTRSCRRRTLSASPTRARHRSRQILSASRSAMLGAVLKWDWSASRSDRTRRPLRFRDPTTIRQSTSTRRRSR